MMFLINSFHYPGTVHKKWNCKIEMVYVQRTMTLDKILLSF